MQPERAPAMQGLRHKHFRKRKAEKDEDEVAMGHLNQDKRRRHHSSDGDEDQEEVERERAREQDQQEKTELERRLRERDDRLTKNVAKPKLSRKHEEEAERRAHAQQQTDGVLTLREVSRQEYLKKREQKKLDELRDALEDDKYLFEDTKLTANEEQEMRYKMEVYGLAKQRAKDIDNVVEYRMPEAYDNFEGKVKQDKRFAVALERYKDPEANQKIKGESKLIMRNMTMCLKTR